MSVTTKLLTGILASSGTLHLTRPRIFDRVVPRWVPGSARGWVYVSGVAELACAAALAHPRTRAVGGLATAALMLAVFPGNVQMFQDARSPRARAITLARLPLQLPLILWALRT